MAEQPSNEQLKQQLAEAHEVIRALQRGEVDAIISQRDIALVRLRATEEALRKLTAELEERVRDRTRQLEDTNRRLGKAMDELKTAQVRVLEAERVTALAALAAAIAHEVNSPLMGVLNAVAYVRRNQHDPRFEQALQDADEGLRHIADITRNLLSLSRPAGRQGVRAEVDAVLGRAVGFLEADFQARGIRLEQQIPVGLPPVAVDEVRLQQVFTNLLTNARDALEQSAEKVIRIAASQQNHQVSVVVEDTGPGVPEAVRNRLFEPFFTTKPGRGTGLGLPVSKSLLEDQGGDLILDSGYERGARFVVTLPMAKD